MLPQFQDHDLHVMNVLIDDLIEQQRGAIQRLQTQDCFADVPGQAIEEDFFTTPVSRVVCYADAALVGCAGTRIREIVYEGNKLLLGGISGVCTRTDMRARGVATRVCRMAMEFLREAHCDVVFLSTSPMARKLYENLGFRALAQGFSWENLRGQIKIGENGMVAPICSPAVAAAIWNGQSRLHVGRGYW
jgi:ribosomal protein S18 acetylase RimI-like enzyme